MAFEKPKYFSEFTEEEQNFIIENNFNRLKEEALDWKEVRNEWKIFLTKGGAPK